MSWDWQEARVAHMASGRSQLRHTALSLFNAGPRFSGLLPPAIGCARSQPLQFFEIIPLLVCAGRLCATDPSLCFVSCPGASPVGARSPWISSVTSILLVGSPERELLFHPSWLVWACGSLLITAREQIRGMVLRARMLHDHPRRVKTTAGCSQNSLAD